MAQTSISTVHSGPAWVLIGDPTTSMGAGMVELGLLPGVDAKLNFFRQMAANELGQIMKDGASGAVKDADITLTLQQTSASILAAMVSEIVDETTSISAESAFATLSAQTLCIVPADVKGSSGVSNLKTHWFPAVIATDLGNLVQQIQEGADQREYTVSFKAMLAATDQDDQAINTDYRIWFRGDPDDAINEGTPTSWSLPSGY